MLDPIADKLLVASCLLMLGAENTIHGWALFAAVVILCREILVSGLREYLAELRVSVPVTRLAKWKTTLQLVAVGFLICGEAGDADRAGGDADRHRAVVALGAADALHRLGLSAGGPASPHPGGCVKLRYFAWVRERVGKAEEDVEPPAGVATVGELSAGWRSAARAMPTRSRIPKVIRAAIDRDPCARRRGDRRRRRDRLLSADDGRLTRLIGMDAATIRLQREAFDVAAEVAALTRGRTDIGAVVTFTGICRADENGEPIAALTLEHYPGMAEAEIARHVEEAQRALAAARRHRDPSLRPDRAGRSHRSGGDGIEPSRRRHSRPPNF